jgi:hypothetical protein
MFEIMSESSGNVLGVRAKGVITRKDYEQLVPMCEDLIRREGNICVLIDMKNFELESPAAWLADIEFGREFHNKIEKMAIVGDKRWEAWLTDFSTPFYARDAKYFNITDIHHAWNWVKEGIARAA